LRLTLPREFVFPDSEDAPPGAAQGPVSPPVPGDVGGELLSPEGRVTFRFGAVLRAAVPEAAIHEHGQPEFREDEIGPDLKVRALPRERIRAMSLERWACE
jgi:hypothetical protein